MWWYNYWSFMILIDKDPSHNVIILSVKFYSSYYNEQNPLLLYICVVSNDILHLCLVLFIFPIPFFYFYFTICKNHDDLGSDKLFMKV